MWCIWISNLTKLLTHSPLFQPNLRGPLDSLASVFGLAHRRNLRWHLASSSGEHVCLLLMLLVWLGAATWSSHNCLSIHLILLKPFSPLKDASHLSKTSLISLRNLSPGLATVDVQLETAHPGSQNHFRCVCECISSRRDCVGDNICCFVNLNTEN